MTDQLPYTYTDPNGHVLRVSAVSITVWEDGILEGGYPDAGVWLPEGTDVAALARAVLAAAGDTGHAVVSEAGVRRDTYDAEENGRANGADSMREQIIRTIEQSENRIYPSLLINEIHDLPLLPDGDDTAEGTTVDSADTWPEDDESLSCGPHCQCGGPAPTKPTPTKPNHRARLVAELLGATVDAAAEELNDDPTGTWERAYAAWTNHRRDAATRTNTRYEERLDALEGLTRAVVDLVEGHSVDLSQAKAAIRGLARRPLTADTDH